MDLEEKLRNLSEGSGVYLMKDQEGRVIYVGKAHSLKSRVRSYFHEGRSDLSARSRWMVEQVRDLDYILTDSEDEALILECTLIKKYRPYFNVRLRDDKRYPYLEITTGEEFPRLRIVRRPLAKGSTIFGPSTNAAALRKTLRLMKKLFRIRTCSHRIPSRGVRPCLDYHIGQCSAPCNNKVSREEYKESVIRACQFLQGHWDGLLRNLKKELEREAEALNFERCARLRDLYLSLERVMQKQKVIFQSPVDEDFVAIAEGAGICCAAVFQIREGKLLEGNHFLLSDPCGAAIEEKVIAFLQQYYRQGVYIPPRINVEAPVDPGNPVMNWLRRLSGRAVAMEVPMRGKRADLLRLVSKNARLHLEEHKISFKQDAGYGTEATEPIRDLLALPRVPQRIEAYDISNLGGKEATGSRVVYERGKLLKKSYRRYRIKTVAGQDDYAMLREVLRRRFEKDPSVDRPGERFPDLVLLDGGKGHLAVIDELLKEKGIKVPAIALAKQEEHIFLQGRRDPVVLPGDSPLLLLLRHLRDEAHRFALSYHRGIVRSRASHSVLDRIPGVASKRKAALLRHFGSVHRIREATAEEIERVPGIPMSLARLIIDYLREPPTEMEEGDASESGER